VPRQPSTPAADQERPGAVIVVLNLPVPDDHRVWAQAQTLHGAGARVTVVCPAIRGARPGTKEIDGITVVYFRSFEGSGKLGTIFEGAWTTLTSTRAAKRALSGMKGTSGPRHLQVCNPPDLLFRLLRWARRRGVSTVYDQHDVVPVLAASRPSFRRLEPFFQSCERRTVAAADEILTPSGEQAERLQKLYGRTATVVRTAAVTGGNAGRAAGQAPSETVLGYLGVIGEQDGVVDLLEAVQDLRGRGITGFRVEIAGDGPELPAVRRRVEELNLGDLVLLRGWLGRGEIDGFLDGIDAMVVPDPDVEFNHYCAMNKVTHAMAHSIPVVLRPLRENTRIVGESGILARDMSLPAFADAIAVLLDTAPGERAAIGARLRADFDRELSWSTYAPRYLAAFGLVPVPTTADNVVPELTSEPA
jgi:glycosyltransferase involved in cell wall biosynthesis